MLALQTGKAYSDPVYIAKPENGCQGKGIYLLTDPSDLDVVNGSFLRENRNSDGEKPENYVVQEYLNKPLLIDKMKFDLRLYVLILGVDPLRIFLFKDGLARLATDAYKQPTDDNIGNLMMHLTNYAINKNSY